MPQSPPSRPAWPQPANVLLGAIVFVLSFALYMSTTRHLEPCLPGLDHAPFGGDISGSSRAMWALKFEWKHPLFSLSAWPLIACLSKTLRITPSRAIEIALAVFAAANMTLAFAILRRLLGGLLLAAWFTGLYAMLYANLLVFGIPETYSASNLAIQAYLLAFLSMREQLARRETTRLGILAGIASLFNPPLISLLLIHTLYARRMRGTRHAWAVGLKSVAIAGAIFLSVGVVGQAAGSGGLLGFFEKSETYAHRYVSLENFRDTRILATVPLVFFVYSIAGPSGPWRAPAPDQIGDYLGSPAALIFLALYAVLALAALAQWAREHHPLESSLLPWIVSLVLFYVYWCPENATRFSTQALFSLTIILSRAFSRLRSPVGVKYPGLGAASLCLVVHNWHTLFRMC